MRIATLAGVVAGVIVSAAGIATAGIPGTNGTISACRDSKGTLKVIDTDSGQSCSGNQQPLTWNQQGPAGPAGAAGPPGLSGVETVTATSTISSSNSTAMSVACPGDKKVIGGGAKAFSASQGSEFNHPGLELTQSYPLGQLWTAYANEVTPIDTQWGLRVYAICAVVG